jgi:hypothetical protein
LPNKKRNPLLFLKFEANIPVKPERTKIDAGIADAFVL